MRGHRPDRICASAQATILFDNLDSPNAAAFSTPGLDATFTTGASIFHATDIALLLSGGVAPPPDETFTVSLEGGVPLADVSFDPVLGLNIFPGGPVLGAVTLPVSDLSTSLAIEHFSQFASIALQPNSLYWIGVTADSDPEDNPVNWGYTSDVSGVGVAENYNSSNATDFTFFRNQGVPPFAFYLAFQMEVSGTAAPEPSTWAMTVLGFAGLGFAGYRASRKLLQLYKANAERPSLTTQIHDLLFDLRSRSGLDAPIDEEHERCQPNQLRPGFPPQASAACAARGRRTVG